MSHRNLESTQAAERLSTSSYANGPLGLGVIIGEPTGFTAKYWTHADEAFDLGLTYDFNNFFSLYADYLWHFPEWLSRTSLSGKGIKPYVGLGGVLWIDTESGRTDHTYFTDHGSVGFGLRIPVGLEWLLAKPPIGLFAEIVPGIGVAPAVFAFLQGGVGARIYF